MSLIFTYKIGLNYDTTNDFFMNPLSSNLDGNDLFDHPYINYLNNNQRMDLPALTLSFADTYRSMSGRGNNLLTNNKNDLNPKKLIDFLTSDDPLIVAMSSMLLGCSATSYGIL